MRLAVLVLALAAVPACMGGGSTDPGDVTVIDESGPPSPDDQKADANDLSTAQSKAALLQLNDICGDTWCDGDWWFSFKKIVCHFGKGTCTTTALVFPSATDVHPVPTYWRSCKISGLHRFADLVTTTNGYQSIDQGFYAKMTDCVFAIEAKLPPAP